MKQRLKSTVGEPLANEITFPWMGKHPKSGRVVLFQSEERGVTLFVGTATTAIGVGSGDKYRSGYGTHTRSDFERYDGPVTITGEDIN